VAILAHGDGIWPAEINHLFKHISLFCVLVHKISSPPPLKVLFFFNLNPLLKTLLD